MECEIEPREGARLRASEQCCALFSARGTTDLTITEIASEIGISQRTFYRYFPVKAESVGPVFDWSIRRLRGDRRNGSRHRLDGGAVAVAFRGKLAGRIGRSALCTLFPLVFRNSEMWSVFMRRVHDGELSVAPVVAPRLGLAADSVAARAAAAAVASSIRIALEDMVTAGADPEIAYVRTLAQFTSGPLVATPRRLPEVGSPPRHANLRRWEVRTQRPDRTTLALRRVASCDRRATRRPQTIIPNKAR
ncbi:hypothetical protein DC31_16315 [Microbacterium sp. CH12i]|uniref:helix-turn-helix domain-containing protein n=1 Tax=Microbacterium sp. CH12i TaxID=1479651 RepID=UPI0004616E1B|nr:hypothetical protein DC31_16315 [Microbacterium sp. CH12i]